MEAESKMVVQESQPTPRRGWKIAIGWGVLVLVAGVSATVAMGRVEDPVLARADDITLKQSDVAALLADFDAATRERAVAETATLSAMIRRELGRRILQQKALAEGWDRREDVQQKLERMRLDFIATSFLEAQAAPPPSFPSDAEVETAYQLNQQRFLLPRQFNLAQVYVRRPSDPALLDEARRSAQALAADLRKDPATFAAVARKHSDDTASASQGGALGWLREDQIQPVIRAAAIGLSPGEVSEPIEAADGWHILRLIETKPAGVAPLPQIRDAIVAMLRQQRAQENATAYVTKLMSEKQAAVDEITLAKAQKDLR